MFTLSHIKELTDIFKAWIWPLSLFILLQAFVVLLQDTLGPTFFMPQTVRFCFINVTAQHSPFVCTLQYSAPKTYDYHPPMALPDTESPEKSLGDCAICMDAILIEPPPSYGRSKSFDGRDNWGEKGGSSSSSTMMKRPTRLSSMLNAFHLGSRATEARQIYSLAPCSHLFVSCFLLPFMRCSVLTCATNSILNAWKRSLFFFCDSCIVC